MKKKTVILGATDNPGRYAYLAANKLTKYGHPIIPIGLKSGKVAGTDILTGHPPIEDVDTITLYVGPRNQLSLYDYIIELNPKRIIFNPGTENPELYKLAKDKGIEILEDCTLVMLSVGAY